MIPIISVVGKSGAGKTTFLERLIPELKGRGYRVAVVKHDVHGFEVDVPGKDSWRMAQAGSDAVVIAGPRKLALIRGLEREMTLGEIAALLPDADIILTEGYKRGTAPKIEVSRRAVSQELLCTEEELVALVTDQPFPLEVPQFDLDDAAGVVDLLEERFLKDRRWGRVSLLMDGRAIPIERPFVADIIDRTVRGLVSALRGAGQGGRIVLILDEPRE
ncbi:MAG TPA: molybdopterin-guanine dinucleotide biosynthesis protein B [Anaerolineae bacterium]|nr:molybdopterin-guanine dinucleotide biosynthesis protein B [Anaerolineae bacterium]